MLSQIINHHRIMSVSCHTAEEREFHKQAADTLSASEIKYMGGDFSEDALRDMIARSPRNLTMLDSDASVGGPGGFFKREDGYAMLITPGRPSINGHGGAPGVSVTLYCKYEDLNAWALSLCDKQSTPWAKVSIGDQMRRLDAVADFNLLTVGQFDALGSGVPEGTTFYVMRGAIDSVFVLTAEQFAQRRSGHPKFGREWYPCIKDNADAARAWAKECLPENPTPSV